MASILGFGEGCVMDGIFGISQPPGLGINDLETD